MSNNPDQIRAEIERTRSDLSHNVNALGEAVSPSNVARRQVGKVGSAAAGLKDRVMGTADDAAGSVSDAAGSVSGAVSGAAGSLSESASHLQHKAGDVPMQVKRKAQGNPMAVGLIAVGAGWLLGSLLPATQREQELASSAKEQAKPLLSGAQSVVQESAQHLQQPAMDAAESVKESAQSAVENVKAEGTQAGQDVKGSAVDAKDTLQEQRQTP